MKKVDERTLEYYIKEEGISATNVTLIEGVEIKADEKYPLYKCVKKKIHS